MIIAVGLAFLLSTLAVWLGLSIYTIKRNESEKRLQKFTNTYSKPQSIDNSGEVIATSARIDHPVAKLNRGQAPRDPLGKMLWAHKQRRRQENFLKQIVDSLTLMASSLKAGYSFMQAMDLVAREMPAPLGEEFGLAVHEMSLGATVEESLEEMVRRVPLNELSLVVTAVLVQRQVGGNLAEVLETIAYTIRERIRIRGEISTLTAQGRISGFIVGSLPVALSLMIFAINPKYMGTLFTNPIGWVLIFIGLCGQLIGVLMIRKIIRIEV